MEQCVGSLGNGRVRFFCLGEKFELELGDFFEIGDRVGWRVYVVDLVLDDHRKELDMFSFLDARWDCESRMTHAVREDWSLSGEVDGEVCVWVLVPIVEQRHLIC